MINIVVPIYNAPADVRRCVASVLQHTATESYQLTLIDDASPDPRVAAVLAEIAQTAPQVAQLRNPRNLGFTGTVNRGFSLTTLDVILLNSDAVVTPGWLSAILRCAQSDPKIATITPFSNNAEIASVPRWLENNPAPTDAEAVVIAQACVDIDAEIYPDLPTGVGFCMYLRRNALSAIGEFDEATFGRGYGEENDWCQRAIKAGWRNVLCPGAYVMHTGAQSFSEAKAALVATNSEKLNRKHPGYDLAVQQFIAADSIAPFRKALASRVAALQRRALPGVLHILHGKDGGLERHARDIALTTGDHARHYVLLALGETWQIEDHAGDGILTFSMQHQTDELWHGLLEGVCARFAIDLIHVHHISACRDGLLLALRATKIPYVVTLHDFYYACPPVHLMRPDDTFCNAERDVAACQRCMLGHGFAPQVSVSTWRADNAQLLAGAAHVIAPSAFTGRINTQYFPAIRPLVMPHATPNFPKVDECGTLLEIPNDDWMHLTIVGAIGPLKGARVVEAMAKRLRERKLKVRLILIGYLDTQFHQGVRESGHWLIHGAYRAGELPRLLKAYRTQAVVFPAVGPETFGYALSEVWSVGLPVIVADVGTLAERVREALGGWVLPMPETHAIDVWLDQCLAIVKPENQSALNTCGANGQRNAASGSAEMQRLTEIYRTVESSVRANRLTGPTPVALAPTRWIAVAHDAGTPAATKHPLRAHAMLHAVGRLALRFRYTRLGRWIQNQIPASTKRWLRERLLAR